LKKWIENLNFWSQFETLCLNSVFVCFPISLIYFFNFVSHFDFVSLENVFLRFKFLNGFWIGSDVCWPAEVIIFSIPSRSLEVCEMRQLNDWFGRNLNFILSIHWLSWFCWPPVGWIKSAEKNPSTHHGITFWMLTSFFHTFWIADDYVRKIVSRSKSLASARVHSGRGLDGD
jgi:hypothetical protein